MYVKPSAQPSPSPRKNHTLITDPQILKLYIYIYLGYFVDMPKSLEDH